MKIRNGFVSNSSSSSFILLGVKSSFESMMKNPEFKLLFDKELIECQNILNEHWNNKLQNPDFNKHKDIYEMCKNNNISIPIETQRFFGYRFNGVFEPSKVNNQSLYKELLLDEKFKLPKGITYIDDETNILIGKKITSGDELSDGDMSLEDINNFSNELEKLGFDKNDIKLYYGTYPC